MPSTRITYKFGKKNFTTFLIAEAIGIVLVLLNFLPGTHKIYLIPLIAGFAFIGIGFQMLMKSLKTAHCVKCQKEFKSKEVSYRKEDEENLMRAVQENDASFLQLLELVRNDAKNRCKIVLEFCPACMEIGLVDITKIDGKKTVILKNYEIRDGAFLKALHESMID